MATENLFDFRKTLDAVLAQAGLTVRPDDLDLVKVARILANSRTIVGAGVRTWAGGAATTDALTITGVLSTDIVIATLQAQGAAETLVKAVPTANTVTFTLSANGTNGSTKIQYQVIRP